MRWCRSPDLLYELSSPRGFRDGDPDAARCYRRHLNFTSRRTHLCLLIATFVAFVWSAIAPADRLTWVMEVFPALIAIPVLLWIYPRYRFSTLVYALIALHASILFIGGHYTYAEVPLFNWLKAAYHLDRNYYDRVGHFAQGFVPAAIAREILIRWTKVRRGPMLIFLVLCVAMAVSAWYEILEFVAARSLGSSAESFLGTQGDVWDTQWDMTSCFFGAMAGVFVIPPFLDRAIEHLDSFSSHSSRA
jgi:putative membrane protein